MRLFKQLIGVFAVIGLIIGVLAIFAFDVVKIDWIVFMEIQTILCLTGKTSCRCPRNQFQWKAPPIFQLTGAPTNPVPADEASIARGAQIFEQHCLMCHGMDGKGNGTVAAFLVKKKPADLTSALVQSKSDGTLFLEYLQWHI